MGPVKKFEIVNVGDSVKNPKSWLFMDLKFGKVNTVFNTLQNKR